MKLALNRTLKFPAREKLQIPNARLERSSRLRTPRITGRLERGLMFGIWCFNGAWSLVLGALWWRPYRSDVQNSKRVGIAAGLLLAFAAPAFPPAPHHTLQGEVRDEWGDPVEMTGATGILESAGGVGGSTLVRRGIVPAANFQLKVAMDAGTITRLYKPTALRPFLPFTLKVQIGQATYVPMEVTCTNFAIGQPAGSTWIDLTLGVDSDCDGMPDAWELALLRALGRGQTLADILALQPDGDEDGDGLTNRQEYLASTYAYDPEDGFTLTLLDVSAGESHLEFLAVRGRTYTIHSSANLTHWTPVAFRVVTGGNPGALLGSYVAPEVEYLQVRVPFQTGGETNRFFKAMVQ
jgi:hypothetical protein